MVKFCLFIFIFFVEIFNLPVATKKMRLISGIQSLTSSHTNININKPQKFGDRGLRFYLKVNNNYNIMLYTHVVQIRNVQLPVSKRDKTSD